jgi:hypothetical protein
VVWQTSVDGEERIVADNGDTQEQQKPVPTLDEMLAREHVPDLSFNNGWQNARDVTGDESAFHFAGQSEPMTEEEIKEKFGAGPANTTYAVDPGSIRDAEATILSSLNEEVSAYETFKQDALGKVQWIFLTDNEHGLEPKHNDGHTGPFGWVEGADVTVKDPNPAMTTMLISNLEQVLRTCGDALHMTGDFATMLNNAAQYYAQADKAPFRSEE